MPTSQSINWSSSRKGRELSEPRSSSRNNHGSARILHGLSPHPLEHRAKRANVTGKWKERLVMPKSAKAPRDGSPPGWYSRGYLPHFDGGQIAQAVTFRLFDSLPRSILEQWRQELSERPEKDAETE